MSRTTPLSFVRLRLWQANCETRASIVRILSQECSAVRLDDAAGNGQSHSSPLGIHLGIQFMKHSVYVRFQTTVKSLSVVLNGKQPAIVVTGGRNLHNGRLARATGLGAAEAERIEQASLLHDVGKIGVPDEILHKPGVLSPDERAAMRRHTTIG